MKMLIVSALVCAMMVLTGAAPPSEDTPQDEPERHLVKRSTDCPSGWSLSGDRCYRYFPTSSKWTRAQRNCQALGGNLASVHNIQEYQTIQSVIFSVTSQYNQAWIGGSDAQEESQWFWSDGTPFRYRHWCVGEPNGSGSCMQMNYSDAKCWDDTPCSDQLPYVCAMDSK